MHVQVVILPIVVHCTIWHLCAIAAPARLTSTITAIMKARVTAITAVLDIDSLLANPPAAMAIHRLADPELPLRLLGLAE